MSDRESDGGRRLANRAADYVDEFGKISRRAADAGLTLTWHQLDTETLEVLGQSGDLASAPHEAAARTVRRVGRSPLNPLPASTSATEGDATAPAPPAAPAPATLPAGGTRPAGVDRVRRAAWAEQAAWQRFFGRQG